MTVSILPATSTGSGKPNGSPLAMSQSLEATEDVHDDGSDYGDFTLDEQEIINGLLANLTPGNTVAEEPVELTDIEDYEEPRGVRLPKTLGKELWIPPWMQQQPHAQVAAQTTLENQTSSDIRTTTNGTYASFERWPCADMLTSA